MRLLVEKLKEYCNEDSLLRDYQKENKQKVYEAWSQSNSVMLQMPTGTGKTRLFVSIIKDFIRFGIEQHTDINVLILVHRIELIEQINEVLNQKYDLKHGIIHSGTIESPELQIQLASVQTLSKRMSRWSGKFFDLIVIDEAHHVTAESYQNILNAFPEAKLLGVTATPVRLNGQGFSDTFDELIVSPSIQEFINQGFLSEYNYFSVGRSSFIQKEIDGIKKFYQGDYAQSELVRVCDTDKIRAQVIDTYLKFANGKKGIVYTINKEHNHHLCEKFNENGIAAIAIDSDTPPYLRKHYIEQFRAGSLKIICNVNIFTEGFDCPDIEFIQLARPTKSLALYLQQIGRGLRVSEKKDKTIFLDNVGLYNRFSFPSSRRKWKYHFEGKYYGNELEEEEEPTLKCFTNRSGRLKPDFSEGNEEVHLIQSSEEKKHLENVIYFFITFIGIYISNEIEAINKAYEEIFIKGLGLHTDFFYNNDDNNYDVFHVFVKERTKELRRYASTNIFDFRKSKDELFTSDNYRTCRNLEELIGILDKEFHQKRLNLIKSNVKDLNAFLKLYTSTDIISSIRRKEKVKYFYLENTISEGDIYDFFTSLFYENPSTSKIPKYFDDDKLALFVYFITFISDVNHIYKKPPEIINWMDKSLWDALHKRHKKDKESNNNA